MKPSDYPGLFRVAERDAERSQRRYLSAVLTSMTLLIGNAVLSLVDLAATWSSLVQAAAIIGSLTITLYLATPLRWLLLVLAF